MRCPFFSPSLLLLAGSLFLTACGNKPDGTPYGVDPGKLPDGRRAKAAARRPTPLATGMPKGAELNAVTSGASAGQPAAAVNAGTGAQLPAAPR